MYVNRVAQSLNTLTSATGRRGAMRALGTGGLAMLAALGVTEAAKNNKISGDKKKKKGKPKVGPVGATGPTGLSGPTGPSGPPGPSGLSGWQIKTANTNVDTLDNKVITVFCDSGKRVIGGGYELQGPLDVAKHVTVTDNRPTGDSAWHVTALEEVDAGGAWGLYVYAICADVT